MASTIIIANFSRWRIAVYLLFNLALCAAIGYNLYNYQELSERPLVGLGWVVVPILLLQQASIIRQIILRGLVASWVEDEKLYYLDSYWGFFFSNLEKAEIVSATVG